MNRVLGLVEVVVDQVLPQLHISFEYEVHNVSHLIKSNEELLIINNQLVMDAFNNLVLGR